MVERHQRQKDAQNLIWKTPEAGREVTVGRGGGSHGKALRPLLICCISEQELIRAKPLDLGDILQQI